MEARATRRFLFVIACLLATAVAAIFSASVVTGVALAVEPPAGTAATTTAPEAPPLTRYEQTDEAISYSGTWGAVKKSAASGRSYARADSTGASVNITFDGTRLDWIATQDGQAGLAGVYLDGAFVGTVNLSAAAASYQRVVWSTGTLAGGVHTLRIVRSPGSPSGTHLTIDAVDVAGTLVACRWVEQDDSRIAYEGAWTPRTGSAFTGGADISTSSTGAALTVEFTGTHLAWVGQKESTGGIATVTLDGTQTFTVDLYSAASLHQRTLWDTGQLTPGPHTLRIEQTGAKNSASTGASVAADGFLVTGAVTQAYLWRGYQDTDPRVLHWGTWTTTSVPQASGGSDKRAAARDVMVAVTFTGKKLYWIATTGPGFGKADVSVDGGPSQVVDLSGPDTLHQQKVWSTGELTAGTHTVQISLNRGSPVGTYINVDAFGVLGDLPSTTDPDALRLMWAQQKLADLSYRPGEVDGKIGHATRGAIIAFQKWEGLGRTGKLTDEVLSRLRSATRPTPKKQGGSDAWIEVDKAKQLLLYCKNGTVLWTIPVSTGSPSVGFDTPSRTYKITRKTLETNPRWHPLYIAPRGRYLAIHGYPSVPTRRASAGCIRTQIWDQRELYPLIAVGTVVHVY